MPKSFEAIYAQALHGTDTASGRDYRVWPYLFACTALSAGSVAAVSAYHLASLTLLNVCFGVIAGVGAGFLRKAARVFVMQSVMIVALYVIRFGSVDGVAMALTVSWRIALAFMPGFIFMSAVPQHRLAGALARILPYRVAFVLGATMTFLPRLVSDIREIYHVQSLRDARVLPRDMLRPAGWRDAVGCVLVPSVVRAMTLAHEIALSAEAREFGARDRRTSWPGE